MKKMTKTQIKIAQDVKAGRIRVWDGAVSRWNADRTVTSVGIETLNRMQANGWLIRTRNSVDLTPAGEQALDAEVVCPVCHKTQCDSMEEEILHASAD